MLTAILFAHQKRVRNELIVVTLLLSTVIPMNPNHICKRLCLVAAVEATGEAAVQQPQYVMDGYGLTQSKEREDMGPISSTFSNSFCTQRSQKLLT